VVADPHDEVGHRQLAEMEELTLKRPGANGNLVEQLVPRDRGAVVVDFELLLSECWLPSVNASVGGRIEDSVVSDS
jgi:hypothetical protein